MLMPHAFAVKHDGYLKAYLRTGIPKVIGTGRKVMALGAKGNSFPIHLGVTEFKDKKSHIFIGTIRLLQEEKAKGEFSEYENIDDPMVVIDSLGEILFANSSFFTLFDFTRDEMLGQNVNICMPSPYKENHINYMLNYQRTGISRIIGKQREVVIEKKDGAIVPVYLSVTEKKKGKGESHFIGMLTKRETVSSKPKTFIQQQRLLINSIQTPALICDSHGVIQAFNDAASKLLGYDLSEILGKNVSILVPPPHSEMHDRYIQKYFETGVSKVIPTFLLLLFSVLSAPDLTLLLFSR